MLLYAPEDRYQENNALPELRHVPFALEPQASKILVVEEGDGS